jgi:aspartyl/asparaginyl beta-hydroxylase (cupin superfamily)
MSEQPQMSDADRERLRRAYAAATPDASGLWVDWSGKVNRKLLGLRGDVRALRDGAKNLAEAVSMFLASREKAIRQDFVAEIGALRDQVAELRRELDAVRAEADMARRLDGLQKQIDRLSETPRSGLRAV